MTEPRARYNALPEHRLANGMLLETDDGIVAECACGWQSSPRFTMAMASVVFRDHVEEMEAAREALAEVERQVRKAEKERVVQSGK